MQDQRANETPRIFHRFQRLMTLTKKIRLVILHTYLETKRIELAFLKVYNLAI